jgi:hypothetical protein
MVLNFKLFNLFSLFSLSSFNLSYYLEIYFIYSSKFCLIFLRLSYLFKKESSIIFLLNLINFILDLDIRNLILKYVYNLLIKSIMFFNVIILNNNDQLNIDLINKLIININYNTSFIISILNKDIII